MHHPARTRRIRCCLRHLAILAALLAPPGCSAGEHRGTESPAAVAIAVYTQSLGRGVPDTTRHSFAAVLAHLQSAGLQPSVTRWGIEGEQRLCVVVDGRQAAALAAEIDLITRDVALIRTEFQQLDARDQAGGCDPTGSRPPAPSHMEE